MFVAIAGIVVIALAVLPLFHPGLFPTIDNISVVRLEAMAHELSRKQFPVRYVHDLAHGHGYMLFSYYAPLPFYAGALLHIAGINLVGALKRTYLLGFLSAAGGIFGLSAEFFGAFGGLVSLAVFVFSPFLGYDIYWRGGLGESWALSFVPWVLWLSFRGIRDGSFRMAAYAGIAWACVLLSHNLTAYMAAGFIAVWAFIWRLYYQRSMLLSMAFFGIGFGLSAFFWLPVFINRWLVWVSYLQPGRETLFEGFIGKNLKETLFPTFIPMITNWFAISVPVAGFFVAWRRVRKKEVHIGLMSGLLLFALAGYMASRISAPVWELGYRWLYMFQFPWRFLTMMTVFGAFLTGGMVLIIRRHQWVVALIMVAAAVWFNWANFRPLRYEFVDKYRPEDPCGTSWGFEYLPVWTHTCLKTAWEKPYHAQPALHVTNVLDGTLSLTLNTDSSMAGTLVSSRYYYPGFAAYVDGVPVSLDRTYPHGLMALQVPDGKHMVNIVYHGTFLEQISNSISLATLIGLGVPGILAVWKRNNGRISSTKRRT